MIWCPEHCGHWGDLSIQEEDEEKPVKICPKCAKKLSDEFIYNNWHLENLSLCNNCHCMTRSSQEGICSFVCMKCGGRKKK